jgi:FkbM family methyltransferase
MDCDDLVFDVGMHRGEDSAYYLSLGYRVVAFEANPDLVARCRERFRDAIADGRMTIVAGAIAPPDAHGTVTFYMNTSKSVWGTTSAEWANRNRKLMRSSVPITVPTVDFVRILEEHGTPHYVKIDVEGVDDLVLEAVCGRPSPPRLISMESEKVDFAKLERDLDLLRRAGYSRFKAVQQALWPGRTATVTRADGTRTSYTFEAHASGPFGDDVPQSWRTAEEVLDDYRAIFRQYEWIGDRSLAGRWGRIVTKPVEKVFGIPLPGWHDLHAMRP